MSTTKSGLKKKPTRQIFLEYISTCRRKNIFFELTAEEFNKLIVKNCAYCGREPSNTNMRCGIKYNGLDRIDNNKGYTLKNVVPCCSLCNRIKSNMFSARHMRVLGPILRKLMPRLS